MSRDHFNVGRDHFNVSRDHRDITDKFIGDGDIGDGGDQAPPWEVWGGLVVVSIVGVLLQKSLEDRIFTSCLLIFMSTMTFVPCIVESLVERKIAHRVNNLIRDTIGTLAILVASLTISKELWMPMLLERLSKRKMQKRRSLVDLGRRVRDQRGGADPPPAEQDGTPPPPPNGSAPGGDDQQTNAKPSPAPAGAPSNPAAEGSPNAQNATSTNNAPSNTPAPAPVVAPSASTTTTTTTSSTVQSPPQYGIWVAGVTLFSILGFTFWATSVETFESQVDVDVEKLAQISQESRVQGPRGQRDYTTPTLTYAVGTLSVIAYSLLRSK